MKSTLAWTLIRVSCIALTACPLLNAQCPVNSILVKGRVEHPPRHASVRVLLVYPPDPHKKYPPGTDGRGNDQPGESAEAVLDGEAFTIPVEFLTNDHRTEMTFLSKCNRKPSTVVITLKQDDASGSHDEEYDRVSLDFPRDFKSDDSHHYRIRDDIVLNGPER